jgi:hypothetical protein
MLRMNKRTKKRRKERWKKEDVKGSLIIKKNDSKLDSIMSTFGRLTFCHESTYAEK